MFFLPNFIFNEFFKKFLQLFISAPSLSWSNERQSFNQDGFDNCKIFANNLKKFLIMPILYKTIYELIGLRCCLHTHTHAHTVPRSCTRTPNSNLADNSRAWRLQEVDFPPPKALANQKAAAWQRAVGPFHSFPP